MLCYSDLKLYWRARSGGTSFGQTATIGHQRLHLHPVEIKELRRTYYARFPNSKVDFLGKVNPGDFADVVLRDLLDIQVLSAIDCSPYEGADIIHDLNSPVPPALVERFDAVIDGGSLEHVFNFPVAISNEMRMVRTGGKIFITTVANNYCGHGFYQFSPEVMFRVFVPDNGFNLDRIVFYPASTADFGATSNRVAYEVADPLGVKDRVRLTSRWPVLMMVEATKVADVPSFAVVPLQSDYVDLWNRSVSGPRLTGIMKLLRQWYDRMPRPLKSKITAVYYQRHNSLSNSKFYTRLKL